MSIIEVKNLNKTYESYKKAPGLLNSLKSLFHREKILNEAVRNVNFSLEEGEIVGFLGPNGAGKTTTLKMLSGILYPTSGEVQVLGYTPWERQKDFQKQFAIVMGQKNQLWWDLPAMESFILNKEIYEVPDKQFKKTLDELSEILDIKKLLDIPVRKLSLGERMKCELVAALLHNPKVLFLDEPTIGLDVISQVNIREFLKKYNKETKTTIILTSHYMEDIEALCKRVIVINHGVVAYDGSIENMMQDYIQNKILKISFSEPQTKKDFQKYGHITEWGKINMTIDVSKEKIRHIAAEILTKYPVSDIMIDEVQVEEVIRKIFQQKKV
jgi:ABC-2 type transport system ATP-binding protein